jgi:type VI protein secretion system component Hcp
MKPSGIGLSLLLMAMILPVASSAQGYRAVASPMETGSHVAAAFQEYSAYVTLQGDPGGEVWPNNGQVPVIAYGWRGERPQPVRIATDSGFAPFRSPGSLTTLTIQKRNDIFSPLLQRMFEQSTTIPSATFTINPAGRPSIVYTLYDVRVASIRDVGSVIAENPTTEELVIVFSQMALAGQ